MHQLTMMMTSWCPHCKRALNWMEELKKEDTRFAQIQITIIDEEQEREKAAQMDYYYVPTYFLDGKKLHEGPASKDIVRSVFQKALE